MLPVNYCSGFTSLKLYGHVKFSISIIMYALCIATHYFLMLLFLLFEFKIALITLTAKLLMHFAQLLRKNILHLITYLFEIFKFSH